MYKTLNFIMVILVLIFLYSIFRYYSSNKNISIKNYNRQNIDNLLKEKISDLPILENDTNNVIEFNNSIENIQIEDKKRSFWNLLRTEWNKKL